LAVSALPKVTTSLLSFYINVECHYKLNKLKTKPNYILDDVRKVTNGTAVSFSEKLTLPAQLLVSDKRFFEMMQNVALMIESYLHKITVLTARRICSICLKTIQP